MRYGTGMVMVLTAGLLWSFQALIIRQIDVAGAWTILAWRSAAMVPVLLAFQAWRSGGSPWPAIRKAGLAGVLGGIGLVAAMGGTILAFQTTTIANAAFLLAASPFLAAVLGRLILGEAVASRTWGAIALALAGIFIMVREGLAAGGAAWQRGRPDRGPWLCRLQRVAALAADQGQPARLHPRRRLRRNRRGVGRDPVGSAAGRSGNGPHVVALMGVVTMSGGMILYTLGSRVVPSAELALLSNTEVLLAPFWVWLILGETASTGTFIGGAVVLVAILFNAYAGVRRMAPA